MTLGDRRNKHCGRRGIAIADAPAVEFVSVNLLQDTVCPCARMAVVNAVHAADELVSRLGRTERRILFEAASPLSLAIFRPVLERLQCDPRLEFWLTTSDGLWDVASATRAVVSGLADPTRQSAERRALADQLFYRPGSATPTAVGCIHDLLDIAAPEGVRDAPAERAHAIPSAICALPATRTTHHV